MHSAFAESQFLACASLQTVTFLSHNVPENPDEQEHPYLLIPSVQSPPFMHGDDEQSSVSDAQL